MVTLYSCHKLNSAVENSFLCYDVHYLDLIQSASEMGYLDEVMILRPLLRKT
jgi:hypothetical protein